MLTVGQEKEKERLRLLEEAKQNQSFGARIRNIFDHHPTPPPAPEKHHLFSRTPPPPEPKDWKDKLNELTGGGSKAEAKEGMYPTINKTTLADANQRSSRQSH
jgi:hypothetical protein